MLDVESSQLNHLDCLTLKFVVMLEDIHIALQEHLKTGPMCYSVVTVLMVSR